MQVSLTDHIKKAIQVSTPIISVRTTDQEACVRTILGGFKKPPAALRWDIVRGIEGVNKAGINIAAILHGLLGADGASLAQLTQNPAEALGAAMKIPEEPNCILFFFSGHRVLGNEQQQAVPSQAAANLRDHFKAIGHTLIILGPSFQLPTEIVNDTLVLDEPLPDAAQLRDIVVSIHTAAKVEQPAEEVMEKAIEALSGIGAFPADQAVAMSLDMKTGVDVAQLWDRKRQMIESQAGLSVWRGPETFDGIGGMANIKNFLRQVLAGNESPRAIVFIDEIEKSIGTGQDTSGVSQSLLGTLLSYMQDNHSTGIICIGPPGTSKSMLAKAAGNEAGIPTVAFDLSGMKASLVGESEQRLRSALKVVSAVSQGRTLFIATCNSIGVLPPELRRRFTFGTFFFDLPSAEERAEIWKIYGESLKLDTTAAVQPEDKGWTGAEIRQCCELAWRLRCSLIEAAAYIVPVARSAQQQIDQLRSQASGKFISASYPGIYLADRQENAVERALTRNMKGQSQ